MIGTLLLLSSALAQQPQPGAPGLAPPPAGRQPPPAPGAPGLAPPPGALTAPPPGPESTTPPRPGDGLTTGDVSDREYGLKELLKLRDPFLQPDIKPPEKPVGPLQKYGTPEFELTAIITGPKRTRAILKDPEGKSHFVRVGDLIGLKEGKITNITKSTVVVNEKDVDYFGQVKMKNVNLTITPASKFSKAPAAGGAAAGSVPPGGGGVGSVGSFQPNPVAGAGGGGGAPNPNAAGGAEGSGASGALKDFFNSLTKSIEDRVGGGKKEEPSGPVSGRGGPKTYIPKAK